MEATEGNLVLPGTYAILSKSGKAISLDGLSPEEAYAKLEGDDPLTVYASDIVVTFRGGYVSALDTFSGKVARKEHTPEVGERLLKLLIDEDAAYDGVEEFFSDFPVRFVP